jgi:hypothetical protein
MTDAREVIVRWLVDDMSMDDNEFIPEIADELLSALKAAGLVVVPREPTTAMVRASTCMAPTWDDDVSRAKWRAMVEAAKDGE